MNGAVITSHQSGWKASVAASWAPPVTLSS